MRNLAAYDNSEYAPSRSWLVRLLWYYLSWALVESGIVPVSAPKRALLRLFGANIGQGVVIKPHVRIKYPWRLKIGDFSWIGEDVWIDNLDDVSIGSNVCVSQAAYLCTGSHDHTSETFTLKTKPIVIEDGAWICARATLLPGVVVHHSAVIAAGSVVTKSVPSDAFAFGVPAKWDLPSSDAP